MVIQFLVGDRYFSQYLHEMLARLEDWQDPCIPEEVLLQSLLALCVQLLSGGPGPAMLDDFLCELGKLTPGLVTSGMGIAPVHQCWMEGIDQLMGVSFRAAYAEVCEPPAASQSSVPCWCASVSSCMHELKLSAWNRTETSISHCCCFAGLCLSHCLQPADR